MSRNHLSPGNSYLGNPVFSNPLLRLQTAGFLCTWEQQTCAVDKCHTVLRCVTNMPLVLKWTKWKMPSRHLNIQDDKSRWSTCSVRAALLWSLYREFTLPPWSIRVKVCIQTSGQQPEQEKGSVWWSDTRSYVGISRETTHTHTPHTHCLCTEIDNKRGKRSSCFVYSRFTVCLFTCPVACSADWTHSLSTASVCAAQQHISEG